VAVTEFLTPSSITIGCDSFLNIEKLLQSLDMWCDTPESMTYFGAAAAAVAALGAQAVSQKGSQSPVVGGAAVAVGFFTFHHSFIRL